MDALLPVLKALGNETRWQILDLLGQGPLCVNALVCRLKVSQPAVSQHLRLLEQTGLVRGEKTGLKVHYALIPERLRECMTTIDGLVPSERREVDAMPQEHKACDCRQGKEPKNCSPEQIRECHPEGGHRCEEKGEKGTSTAQK